ncbi:hypothetical protein FDG2_4982 [Candidatus Protofrankia californiensis]|uniref:Uncharacterized protein n=1 Tax=Candidatus Protofrankia californiensis TaxID=1839754 RepID=A0A1C3P9X2_9ACTN|nr:hypothetical protein FDG2_4982 [Candidatus Protofrankia californiensis]
MSHPWSGTVFHEVFDGEARSGELLDPLLERLAPVAVPHPAGPCLGVLPSMRATVMAAVPSTLTG